VASVAAVPLLEDETFFLVEPRIKDSSMRTQPSLATREDAGLVYTARPEALAFSRGIKTDTPTLDALAGTVPGVRTNIDERPCDCMLPFAVLVP
jgi:hypothetical protein